MQDVILKKHINTELKSRSLILIGIYSYKQNPGGGCSTHKRFLGLIMKHHRVQMAPVAVKAMFCVRESFSAGRWKSLIPAITRAHCVSSRMPHVSGTHS